MNLSLGGMLLRLKRSLTPGSSYFIKLWFEDQVAIVEARVVRIADPSEDYECLAALQFTSLAADDAKRLRGFVSG